MIENLHESSSASGDTGYGRARARGEGGWLIRAGKFAMGLVYPDLCPSCREQVAGTGGLCAGCWRETNFIAAPACDCCGAPVAAGLGDQPLCDSCVASRPTWSRGAAALIYEGTGRRMTLALKNSDRLDIAPIAAGWMALAGGALIAAADVIAPVPLTWRRLVARRYNQSAELAREVAEAAGKPEALEVDLIQRTRWVESQEGKSRTERVANVEGAFAPGRRAGRAAGATVLLVDDVMTTGATLAASAEACRAAGAVDVNVLVLARVARSARPS